MRIPWLVLVPAAIWAGNLPLHAYPLQVLTTNVQPLSGTASGGNTFPGAVLPFGMVQWSPDTSPSEPGGYLYTASQIIGFSLDHLSGAGDPFGGDFAFTPIQGSVTSSPGANGGSGKTNFPATFFHANEIATPGYYSVQFTNGIRTELTATARTGFGRFTFPAGPAASMVVNAGSGAPGTVNASIQINPGGNEISGWTIQTGFDSSGQTLPVYFDAVFDHAFASYGVWNGTALTPGGTNAAGSKTGVYVSFNLTGGGVVLARTALSYVSVTNAQANLQRESPAPSFTSAGFDAMATAASNNWNGYLNKIQLSGGTPTDRATFYTMMYHALQAPSVVSDVNGQYTGFEGQIHTTSGFSKYEYFSGWDIYRNECQFVAMMDSARASDMAQSLVQDALDGGAMPRWSVANGDTGVMIGDPATPIIAGLYAFGATNFSAAAALAAMVRAALNPATVSSNGIYERYAERDYLNLGYVPEFETGGKPPVSMTLEYCTADFALGRLAQALGDTTNYVLAMNRAQNWRNLYNRSSGYLQMRRSDGLWSPGFTPTGSSYDNYGATDEGSAAQYTWMVPFNLGSLIARMGGPQAAAARLDTFFTLLNDGSSSQYAYVGNEPCSGTPWIYNFLGEPYKASGVVRQIMTQLYSPAPGGLPGNDDLGQMSSWYVLAALGMHPEIPGDDVLTLTGPLFPEAVIHLTNGDVTITGNGAADSAPYIQSLTVNGQSSGASWIRYADIAGGANLAFTMGAVPNTNWGSNLLQMPPSYMDGMDSPLAPTYLWGTGLETGETQITWTNLVDTAPYPAGGSSNIGPIKSTAAGPELGVRSENSQSGSGEIMYSGKALGGTSEYAYMKAFDLSAQNLVLAPGMHFSYWIFPQSQTNYSSVTGKNSTFVALDLIFTDGTNLRDSGLTDQHGVGINPTNQGVILLLDTWNYVSVDLTTLAGKIVNRINLGYDQPGSSGGYRGYVDDIAFTTSVPGATNLALNQPASADSQPAGNGAANGNDGNTATRWSANDGNSNHWWQVDLGGISDLTGDEVLWQMNGVIYDYTVMVSMDSTNWSEVVNKQVNQSTAQDQSDVYLATARYVRITVTGLPPGDWASFDEFRVFGARLTLPTVPSGLRASGGYGLVSLNWPASAGATSYLVSRSTSSGNESTFASVATPNFTDAGLTCGVKYYYTVAAENSVGTSGNSAEVTGTPGTPVPGSYAAAVMAENPLAYWPLNETNGPVAWDWAGGYDGTYVGGVTLAQPGVSLAGFVSPSYAAMFDGISGYVDIPQDPFNLTNAVTVMAWVKVPAIPHFSGIIGRGNSSWRLTVSGSGNPGGCDGDNGDATSSTSIVGSSWHMVAYTYTGVPSIANNGSLYVDGVLVAADTVPALVGSAYDVWIGGSPDYGTARLFPGSIAHAAFFAQALSVAQVLALYQAGSTAPPVTLTIAPAGAGNLTISWLAGTLLQSTNVTGPWTTNPAVSPCLVTPANSQIFFKVRVN